MGRLAKAKQGETWARGPRVLGRLLENVFRSRSEVPFPELKHRGDSNFLNLGMR